MNLNVTEWREIPLIKIFDIYTGGDLIMSEIEEGDIPIASNSCANNNIACYTSMIEGRRLFDCTKSISIADRGQFKAFIQPKDFYIATRVKALVCKEDVELSRAQMGFIVTIINQESFKFSYGRNCCANLSDMVIKLPIQRDAVGVPIIDKTKRYSEDGYVPNWKFMQNYINSLHYKPLITKNKKRNAMPLNTDMWKSFIFEDIFEIKRGESLYITDSENGTTPYASASAEDNGISAHLNVEPNHEGNCLVINYDGSVGDAYYQPAPFFASEKVVTVDLKDKVINPYIALFIASVIKMEKYRFSYGRKWTVESSMKKSNIKLPVKHNMDGTIFIDKEKKYSKDGYVPDWKLMENYIKSLPYGDRLCDVN